MTRCKNTNFVSTLLICLTIGISGGVEIALSRYCDKTPIFSYAASDKYWCVAFLYILDVINSRNITNINFRDLVIGVVYLSKSPEITLNSIIYAFFSALKKYFSLRALTQFLFVPITIKTYSIMVNSNC